jgi:O-antigen/teichoic acid export membrane protein
VGSRSGTVRDRSPRSVLVRGGSWQVVGQVVPLAVNIALTPLIIAGLGLDRYGLFMLVNVLSGVLQQFDGGVYGAAQRSFGLHAGAGDRRSATRLLLSVLLVVTAAAGVLFGVCYLLAPAVVGLFRVPGALLGEGTHLLRAVVAIIALAMLRNLFTALINAQGRFALTNTTLLAGHLVYVVGLLVTLHQGWGLRGIAWTLLAQQVLATLVIVPAACALLDRRGVRLLPWRELRAFFAYGLAVQWSGLMNLVNLQADALVVGAVLPVRAVGVLTSGSNFANQLRMVPMNILAPVQAVLARRVGQGDDAASRALFERVQHWWVVGTAGWGVVGAGAAGFGVAAWLGPDFHLSGVVATVMLVGYLPGLMGAVLAVWTQVLGRPRLAARCATVAAVLNIALTLALIGPFGIPGTVTATAISQVVAAVLLLRLAQRELDGGVRSFLRDVPVAACAVTAVVVLACELAVRPLVPSGALGLLACGAAAAPALLVYGCLAVGPRRAVQELRALRARRAAAASPVRRALATTAGPTR